MKLGHRVARKRPPLGRVDPFLDPSCRWVRVHSEADRSPGFRLGFLPSFLSFFLLRAALSYSLNYRIDHSRSPRGRPSRSSRGSGTADCLTRRPLVRLHMTQPPQSLLRRGRFYGSLPLARRECPPPFATTPDSCYQRRSAPFSSTPSVTPMSREGGLWESQHAVSAKLSIALCNYDGVHKTRVHSVNYHYLS